MRERLPLLALAGALLVGSFAVLLLHSGARGDFAEALSTYRSEASGTRALFLLAQKAGLPVARRHLRLETIEGTPELVLLGADHAAPAGPEDDVDLESSALDEYETKGVLAAVDRGATLIVTAGTTSPLLTELGLAFTAVDDHSPRALVAFSPGPLTRGVSDLRGPILGTLAPVAKTAKADQVSPELLPVLVEAGHEDRVVAMLVRRGRGRVLVLAAPALATNAALAQGDTARFWLDALGELRSGATIEFDEYHHGFTGERSLVGYAARYGLQWAIVQALFGLALWVWAMRRFGRVHPEPEQGPSAGADFLLAMARLYQLGGHRAHAAEALVRGALRALQELSRAPRDSGVEQVARALEPAHADLAAELRALHAASRAQPLDEPGLLDLAQRAAALRRRALGVAPSEPSIQEEIA